MQGLAPWTSVMASLFIQPYWVQTQLLLKHSPHCEVYRGVLTTEDTPPKKVKNLA